ncbi:sulfurtransferase TusA family protein [Streptomyces fradiae]|uniref:sulfurtransferase TusA family protein n=1 Tax=Streptomyces fradiae TaxID=1906 RepID=UPI0036539E4C
MVSISLSSPQISGASSRVAGRTEKGSSECIRQLSADRGLLAIDFRAPLPRPSLFRAPPAPPPLPRARPVPCPARHRIGGGGYPGGASDPEGGTRTMADGGQRREGAGRTPGPGTGAGTACDGPPPVPGIVVDGTGLLCVTLLLRLRARVAGAEPGTVVHVVATDPAAPLDLPAWCHMTGHTVPRPGRRGRRGPDRVRAAPLGGSPRNARGRPLAPGSAGLLVAAVRRPPPSTDGGRGGRPPSPTGCAVAQSPVFVAHRGRLEPS